MNAVWIRVPDLKSIPKFSPFPPIASAPIKRIVPDSEKNHFEAPMKSNVQPFPRRAAPSAAGWETSRERPIAPSAACVASTAVNSVSERADAEREGEALDFRGGQREQDERGHERHHVRVDDRREPAPVAGGDARDDRAPAADLLLDALEDHDVRVGRDPDREDQAGDPRQRQRDRDQLDQREVVDPVDDQPADRDRAEHAVEDQQEQAHHGEAEQTRDQALAERLFAERRRHLRLGDQVQLDRQRAGLQLVREVFRGGQREAAGDLRALRGVDPFRVLRVVDRRRRDHLAVEHDREVLQRRFLAHARQLRFLAALRRFPW